MKKLLWLLLLVGICSSQSVMNGYWTKYRKAAAPPAGCNPATNEVGTRAVGGATEDLGANYSFAYLATPDCNGNLKQAYFYNGWAQTGLHIKIGVYLDDGDNAPDTGDTQVGTSNIITTTASAEWITVADTIGGSVSTGSNYWVVASVESAQRFYRGTGAGAYYLAASGWYATPPATLATMSAISESPISFYVSIE